MRMRVYVYPSLGLFRWSHAYEEEASEKCRVPNLMLWVEMRAESALGFGHDDSHKKNVNACPPRDVRFVLKATGPCRGG